MSLKEHYIQEAKEAKIEHKKWVNQIRLIISGLETNKELIALNPSASHFGNWLYSNTLGYTVSNSKLVLDDIELLFDKCYEEYHHIYTLLLKEQNSGILASLFGVKKASSSDYKIASQHYETLLLYSDKLLSKMQLFENQLSATSVEKFAKALEDNKISQNEPVEKKKSKEQRYYRGHLIEE